MKEVRIRIQYLLHRAEDVRFSITVPVRTNTKVNLSWVWVGLESLGDTWEMRSNQLRTVANSRGRNIPRIGSGGPAGTFDQVETARNAILTWATVPARVTEIMVIFFSKESRSQTRVKHDGKECESVEFFRSVERRGGTACRMEAGLSRFNPTRRDKIESDTDKLSCLQTNNHVLSGPKVRLETFWGTILLIFSRDDKSLEPKPDEPSKNELKKRAKAAEKEKKAAEKAAKLAEQQREKAEAEEVCRFSPDLPSHLSQL